mgnify:CR=1 FL=1
MSGLEDCQPQICNLHPRIAVIQRGGASRGSRGGGFRCTGACVERRPKARQFNDILHSNMLKNPTRRTFDLRCRSIDLEFPTGQPTTAVGRRNTAKRPSGLRSAALSDLLRSLVWARRALEILGRGPPAALSFETDLDAVRVARRAFPNTVHLGDITKAEPKELAVRLREHGRISRVLVVGGFPCQGHTVLNVDRKGSADPRSQLVGHMWRLIEGLKRELPEATVDFLGENAASMAEDEVLALNKMFGRVPVSLDAADLGWVRRPRLYWLSWDLLPSFEMAAEMEVAAAADSAPVAAAQTAAQSGRSAGLRAANEYHRESGPGPSTKTPPSPPISVLRRCREPCSAAYPCSSSMRCCGSTFVTQLLKRTAQRRGDSSAASWSTTHVESHRAPSACASPGVRGTCGAPSARWTSCARRRTWRAAAPSPAPR